MPGLDPQCASIGVLLSKRIGVASDSTIFMIYSFQASMVSDISDYSAFRAFAWAYLRVEEGKAGNCLAFQDIS